MVVPRELVAGRAGLIGVRGRQNGFCRCGRIAIFELVEPHVVAPADDVEIAGRHMGDHQKHALIVDGIVHQWSFNLFAARPTRAASQYRGNPRVSRSPR